MHRRSFGREDATSLFGGPYFLAKHDTVFVPPSPRRYYPCQSIFVHEFGHAVMNLGMPTDTRQRLQVGIRATIT